MKKAELNKKLKELENEQRWRDIQSNARRGRSISVGMLFGGTTEITMRGDGDALLWCVLQPVEVVELIHQLSANIGCHIHLQPRKDFASWRDWRVTDEEKQHLNGFPPFVNDMAPYNQLGAKGIDPQVLAALNAGGQLIEEGGGKGGRSYTRGNENETVATEKPKNRRSAKRAATAA